MYKKEGFLTIHNLFTAITLYHIKREDKCGRIEVVKTDSVTRIFTWAQWDCNIQSLYFIHFRKSTSAADGDDNVKQEFSPTLSGLQFHEDMPHETVVSKHEYCCSNRYSVLFLF